MDFLPNSTNFCWRDISSYLISVLNYGFDSGHLSVSQRRGVIKLIPKKDAELYFIKNWWPITLLNTDYKIAAKSIANRIKLVLPNLINHDQTGLQAKISDSLTVSSNTPQKRTSGACYFLLTLKRHLTLQNGTTLLPL